MNVFERDLRQVPFSVIFPVLYKKRLKTALLLCYYRCIVFYDPNAHARRVLP